MRVYDSVTRRQKWPASSRGNMQDRYVRIKLLICMHANICPHYVRTAPVLVAACMHAGVHACMRTVPNAGVHTCMHACLHACIHAGMHACIEGERHMLNRHTYGLFCKCFGVDESPVSLKEVEPVVVNSSAELLVERHIHIPLQKEDTQARGPRLKARGHGKDKCMHYMHWTHCMHCMCRMHCMFCMHLGHPEK